MDLREILIFFGCLVTAVICHEVSHGVVALWCGDDTAKRAGRLTLNPVPHVDPLGSIILRSGIEVYGRRRGAVTRPSEDVALDPTCDWGRMLAETQSYLQRGPHAAIFPRLAIVISCLGFNLLGDGLREAIDPKFRR